MTRAKLNFFHWHVCHRHGIVRACRIRRQVPALSNSNAPRGISRVSRFSCAVEYDVGMEFDERTLSGRIATILGIGILVATFLVSVVLRGWIIAIPIGAVLCHAIWALVTRKEWRIQVRDGALYWTPFFPLRRWHSVQISEIFKIEVNLDEPELYRLFLVNGWRMRVPIGMLHSPDRCIALLVARNPKIWVERGHLGTS